ncbi:hypothetical protein [Leifsonia sp. C5G2]|uniref:hypothetical protein n=1 Tax=Leifsonia sp. C5G2 TaxID=2735269 RepID=UPI001585750D|nr:hypothetical protein [Leifsonia sp. C5G2]NUU07679.1 hypothetical protein [Leifsonia sp. C5G2]
MKERAGVLLRILLLDPDPRVPVEGAAAVMGIATSGFGQYLAQLRRSFGDDALVPRANGHVWFAGDREGNDAALIKSIHSEVAHEYPDSAALSPETAGRIMPGLERIERLYAGNPAMGLSGFSIDDVPDQYVQWAIALDDVVSEWMERWSSVQLLLADCRMTLAPDRQTGRRVLADLLKIARNRDPDEEVFPRLLRAAKMSQDIRQHRNAWELVRRFYEQERIDFPDELSELAPRVSSLPNTPWAPHRARPLSEPLESGIKVEDHLHEIARLLGITTDSTLALRGAEVEPAECIARTTRRLYFSGILASKWVMEPGLRSEFDEMLIRLDGERDEPGDVRFMIIDPDGDAYKELLQLRGGRLSKESVPHLRDLASRHPSFEVRVVNSLPAFRIVVIDDDVVSFSPYALEGERYATSKLGWEAPHVLLDPLAPYPLADAFRLYFEERWLSAKVL